MNYYNYIFYKIYSYLKDGNWALYPQIETIFIITILPVLNLLFILYLLSLFNLHQLDFSYITSNTAKYLIIVFSSILVFNTLYFFLINSWKEIIISFRKQTELPVVNKIIYLYILFSTISFATVYLSGGLFVK